MYDLEKVHSLDRELDRDPEDGDPLITRSSYYEHDDLHDLMSSLDLNSYLSVINLNSRSLLINFDELNILFSPDVLYRGHYYFFHIFLKINMMGQLTFF